MSSEGPKSEEGVPTWVEVRPELTLKSIKSFLVPSFFGTKVR